MSTVAEVRMWGRRIGAVSLDDGASAAVFQYAPEFARSGIEVAPLVMALGERPYAFPDLNPISFHGLPGLLADSLPDRFGNALIDAWLARQGRDPASFNAVERLCYIGTRGMGALEFHPTHGPETATGHDIDIAELVKLASDILTEREALTANFDGDERAQAMRDILSVGTSAGGARAKAVIAWNPNTSEVRSGQLNAGPGFQQWLLKFDGVSGNKDRETFDDPQGYGVIEYAYHLMAIAAGVTMTECRLLEEGGRRHFMTRRFDRITTRRRPDKLHMQSLAALCHFDFRLDGGYSYEQALLAIRQLNLGADAAEQMYRRMVFNVIARNQDDHVKNIAFLMDRAGRWALAPAFDVTYAYNPQGQWTARHQMTVNGKRDRFTLADLHQVADAAILPRGAGQRIIGEVLSAVRRWGEFAAQAGVPDDTQAQIASTLRLRLPAG